MATLLCSKCKKEKAEKFFPKDCTKTSGYRSDCKDCHYSRSKKIRDRKKNTIEGRISYILYSARKRAKYSGIDFNLDKEYLLSLWEKQNGKCAVSGRSMSTDSAQEGCGRISMDTTSLDKVIPNLGYVKGNVRFTTYHVNIAINEYGEDAFLELCSDVLANKKYEVA